MAHVLHLAAQQTTVPGEAMKRPIIRFAAAALGALAVVAIGATFAIGTISGNRTIPAGATWAVPLLAGGAVGLLSWLLLTGSHSDGAQDGRRASVSCGSCGSEVLEDWRLCPYCGGSNEPTRPDGELSGMSPRARG